MPERTKRQRGPETREALLRAAVSVVERDGIAAATTRRIADEAGLPLGAVHYWFADKADLLEAVIGVLLQDVRSGVVDGEPAADESIGARLDGIHARYAHLPEGRQVALFEVTTHALRTEGLAHLAQEQYRVYDATARAGIEPWRAQADRILPGGSTALATLLVAVMDGLTLAELASPDAPEPAQALRLFGHLLTQAGLDA